jgi:hypothetical protein
MKKLFGVGINKFADPSAQLNGCVNDTANIRELCVSGPLAVDPTNIRLVCDERATRLNIFERLDWCNRGWTGKGDKLIVQFSCHGSQVVCRNGDELDDDQDEVLCPYDFPDLWDSPSGAPDVKACEKFLGHAPYPQICDDDLAVFLKKIPEFVTTTLIIDACHSGSIDRDLRFGPPESRQDARFVPAPFDIRCRGEGRKTQLIRRKLGHKPSSRAVGQNVHYIDQRHVLLSGCRDDQTSADAYISNMSQGAMTWSFITTLTGLGYFTGKTPSWLQVHDEMLRLLRNNGYDQVPQLAGPRDLLNGPVFGA